MHNFWKTFVLQSKQPVDIVYSLQHWVFSCLLFQKYFNAQFLENVCLAKLAICGYNFFIKTLVVFLSFISKKEY